MHPSEAISPRDALGARVTAAVLDLIVCVMAAAPFSKPAGWGAAAVFFVLYHTVSAVTGYSPGKAILGVKVVKQGTTDAPGPVKGFIRSLVGVVEVPIFVIGAIVSGTNDQRRRAGDMAAGTEVVGLSLSGRQVIPYAFAYFALLSLFLGLSTVNTLLIVWAIFIPMGVAFVAVIQGSKRDAAAIPWLVTAGFSLVPAAYLSFSGLCAKGEKTCGDLSDQRKAIPALIVMAIVLLVFFVLRGGLARAVLAVGTLACGAFMVSRLFATDDMNLGAILLIILLIGCLLSEVVGRVAANRAARVEGAGAGPAPA